MNTISNDKNDNTKLIFPGIQLCRILAACMILIHHLPWDVEKIGTLGRSSVSIFLAISGFLAGYNSSKVNRIISLKENLKMLSKKLKKFYWVYLIAYLLSVALTCAHGFMSHENVFTIDLGIKSLIYLTLTQSWIPISEYTYSIVPACWYLSMIMFLYFCQCWLVYFAKTIKKSFRIITAIGCILVLITLTICLKNSTYCNYFLYFFPLTRILNYYVAIVVGVFFRQISVNEINKNIQTLIQLLSIGLFIVTVLIPVRIEWQYNLYYFIPALFLVVSLALPRGGITFFSKNKIIVKIASITSITFITHHVVYQYIAVADNYVFHMNPYLLSGCAIVIVFINALFLSMLYKKMMKRREGNKNV